MNKKHRLALIPGLLVICGASCAQSSVTFYGVLDNGLEVQNGGRGNVVREVSSGLYASVYGFRGREDLGGGNRANFQLENGFSGDTGAATDGTAAFNRLAWLGISGAWGEFRLGRQKKPEYQLMNNEMDPSGVKSIASPIINFMSTTVRASDAITYFTPRIGPVQGQFMVSLRDDTTVPQSGVRLYNGVLDYKEGPLRAIVGYERWSNAAGTSLQKVFRAVVSYGVDKARYYLAYQSEKQTDGSEKRDIFAPSMSYWLTPTNQLSLMYGYLHDRTGKGNNAQQLGLLVEHFASKSLRFYTAMGVIQNRNQAAYTLNGTQYSGTTVNPGSYARGIVFGVAKRF